MTDLYAVVGDPVEHSLSPVIQQAAFDSLAIDATYSAIRVESSGMESVIGCSEGGRRSVQCTRYTHPRRAGGPAMGA